MGEAPGRVVIARHALRGAALLGLTVTLAAVAGCQERPPLEPLVRPAARHPIQPPRAETGSSLPAAADSSELRPLTPGPNSRISPTPDMAPRVAPTYSPGASPSSSRQDLDELNRDLGLQRRSYEREKPGPPAGTIDLRPGTIRPKSGTIEVPR